MLVIPNPTVQARNDTTQPLPLPSSQWLIDLSVVELAVAKSKCLRHQSVRFTCSPWQSPDLLPLTKVRDLTCPPPSCEPPTRVNHLQKLVRPHMLLLHKDTSGAMVLQLRAHAACDAVTRHHKRVDQLTANLCQARRQLVRNRDLPCRSSVRYPCWHVLCRDSQVAAKCRDRDGHMAHMLEVLRSLVLQLAHESWPA